MHQKYSDYLSLTQVSNTIHNLWLYKLKRRKRLNLHRFTHNIQVKLIGLKQNLLSTPLKVTYVLLLLLATQCLTCILILS